MKSNLDLNNKIEENKEKIELIAEKIWDAYNEVEPDPMHPIWKYFDDEIKEKFREAAKILFVECECK